MHKIIAVLLFAGLMQQGLYSAEKNPLEKEKIKGGFRICKEYEFSYNFGKIDTTTNRLLYLKRFDEKGNETEIISYNPDGSIYDKWIYNYNSKGYKIEEIFFNSYGSINYKNNYHYDDNGKLVESFENVLNDWYGFKVLYNYNEKNKLENETWYHSDNSIEHKSTFKYNEIGNVIEEISYNSDFRLSLKKIYEYNSNGNLVKEVEYGMDSIYSKKEIKLLLKKSGLKSQKRDKYLKKCNEKYIYLYNDKGNLTEELDYNCDDIMNKIIRKYDEKNNEIEFQHYRLEIFGEKKLKLINMTRSKYDEFGNKIEEIKLNSNNEPISCIKYIYSK
jgi:hypothetical protein